MRKPIENARPGRLGTPWQSDNDDDVEISAPLVAATFAVVIALVTIAPFGSDAKQ